MFRQNCGRVSGTAIGGLLGWLIARGLLSSSSNQNTNQHPYATFTLLIMAGLAMGAIVSYRCTHNNALQILKRNTNLLDHLDKIVLHPAIPLLTADEFTKYKSLIKNYQPHEITVINNAIEKYHAALTVTCESQHGITQVKDLQYPVTLEHISGKYPSVIYDYQELRQSIERDKAMVLVDHKTGVELNLDNFRFTRNYVPEIRQFIDDVRNTIRLAAAANPNLIFYNINPSRYPLLATSPANGQLTTIAVTDLDARVLRI